MFLFVQYSPGLVKNISCISHWCQLSSGIGCPVYFFPPFYMRIFTYSTETINCEKKKTLRKNSARHLNLFDMYCNKYK